MGVRNLIFAATLLVSVVCASVKDREEQKNALLNAWLHYELSEHERPFYISISRDDQVTCIKQGNSPDQEDKKIGSGRVDWSGSSITIHDLKCATLPKQLTCQFVEGRSFDGLGQMIGLDCVSDLKTKTKYRFRQYSK